jgi:negative modulator of initiation of replication
MPKIKREYLFSPGENGEDGPVKPSFPLEECILEPQFRFERDAVGRFLFILSWLHKRHSKDFAKVLDIRGRSRRYFATSANALEESGTSVNPQKIPNSSYWVVTNNDTPKKGRILYSVAYRLGYPPGDAIRLGEALD